MNLQARDRADDILVFVHVPRCGGSNLWTALNDTAGAVPGRLALFDAFAEPLLEWGSCDGGWQLGRMIAERRLRSTAPMVVHQHGAFGLHHRLAGLSCRYFTLLREPGDRFLSSVQHMHRLLVHELAGRARGRSGNWLEMETAGVMAQAAGGMSRVEREVAALYRFAPSVLTVLREARAASNYYVRMFCHYFHAKHEAAPGFGFVPDLCDGVLSEAGVAVLAEGMARHFCHIGRTETFRATAAWLEAACGMPLAGLDRFRNSSGCAGGRLLRLLVAPYFHWDRRLLSALATPGSSIAASDFRKR